MYKSAFSAPAVCPVSDKINAPDSVFTAAAAFGRRTVVKCPDTESRIYCRVGDGGRQRNSPSGFYIFLAYRGDREYCIIQDDSFVGSVR